MNIVRYIIRAIKYYIFICALLALFLGGLIAINAVESNIDLIFRNGYDSLKQIAVMFAGVALIYPLFGYMKRKTLIPGSYEEIRGGIVDFMHQHNYVLEKEDGENLSFRASSIFTRIGRVFEDRVTMTREMHGYTLEGRRRDIIKLSYGLENKFSSDGNREGLPR